MSKEVCPKPKSQHPGLGNSLHDCWDKTCRLCNVEKRHKINTLTVQGCRPPQTPCISQVGGLSPSPTNPPPGNYEGLRPSNSPKEISKTIEAGLWKLTSNNYLHKSLTFIKCMPKTYRRVIFITQMKNVGRSTTSSRAWFHYLSSLATGWSVICR